MPLTKTGAVQSLEVHGKTMHVRIAGLASLGSFATSNRTRLNVKAIAYDLLTTF
jgi:hypothetical protein